MSSNIAIMSSNIAIMSTYSNIAIILLNYVAYTLALEIKSLQVPKYAKVTETKQYRKEILNKQSRQFVNPILHRLGTQFAWCVTMLKGEIRFIV